MPEENVSAAEVFDYEERRRTLKKLRRKAGITQSQLAALSGLSHFTISRFEGGDRDLSPRTLQKVENALADIMAGQKAGQKLTAQLHAERGRTAPLSVMTRAPRSRSRKREQADELASQVAILAGMVATLKQRDENFHEAYTLMTEVIRLYEAEEMTRPKEASALLKRARLLVRG
jgi:transcriptional regulator with XRE-family HTH domain